MLVGLQAVQKQIEYFEGLLQSETVLYKTNVQELLLSMGQVVGKFKKVYIFRRERGSNFPEYDLLVRPPFIGG